MVNGETFYGRQLTLALAAGKIKILKVAFKPSLISMYKFCNAALVLPAIFPEAVLYIQLSNEIDLWLVM